MADVPVKAVEFMAEVKSIKSMADNQRRVNRSTFQRIIWQQRSRS